MIEDVADNFADAFGSFQRLFGVDGGNAFVLDPVLHLDCVDVVDTEGQDIAVVDCIHNRIGMEFVAEHLLRGFHERVAVVAGIDSKNRRAGKPKQVIILE